MHQDISHHNFLEQDIELPDETSYVFIPEKEYLTLKCEVGFYRSLHLKAVERAEGFKQEIQELKGKVRDLKKRVFGKKSEKKGTAKKDEGKDPKPSKRKRGQQPGSKGHGRTRHPDLPITNETSDFPEAPVCPKCGTPYISKEEGDGTTEIIEVEVKAHKRIIKRCCAEQGCSCQGVPKTVSAPKAAKIVPRSQYGISVWIAVLLNKFLYCQPTNRLLNQYKELGLPISAGSITGGLRVLMELFKPVYDALYEQQMTETRFHGDESSWKVFESIEGKESNRWWLWVYRSASVVYYLIAPGRGADVPVSHFENIKNEKIILVCDRYSAYKALVKQLSFIILAFCWAHVRRDFLDAMQKYPELEEWTLQWVDAIATLYHINNQRVKQFDTKLPLNQQSQSFQIVHDKLVEKMDAMVDERDSFIEAHKDDSNKPLLVDVKYKIMTSLVNHWQGLSVFVEHPEVPMDNNKAENSIRNPVTGRKNFYGSGSVWSAELAAIMFAIFQTMALNDLNCHHLLNVYLTACAENQGKAPEDLSSFLPWTMDAERRLELSKPFDTS